MVSQFQGTNSFNLSLSVISKNGKLEGLGVLLSSRSEKGGGSAVGLVTGKQSNHL